MVRIFNNPSGKSEWSWPKVGEGSGRLWLCQPSLLVSIRGVLGERGGQQATWTSQGNHCLRTAPGQGVANSQGNLVPVPGRLGETGHISNDIQGKRVVFFLLF